MTWWDFFLPSPPLASPPPQLPLKRRAAWTLRKHSSRWHPPCICCRWRGRHPPGSWQTEVNSSWWSSGPTSQGDEASDGKAEPPPSAPLVVSLYCSLKTVFQNLAKACPVRYRYDTSGWDQWNKFLNQIPTIKGRFPSSEIDSRRERRVGEDFSAKEKNTFSLP